MYGVKLVIFIVHPRYFKMSQSVLQLRDVLLHVYLGMMDNTRLQHFTEQASSATSLHGVVTQF
jgi:hypothetical protein